MKKMIRFYRIVTAFSGALAISLGVTSYYIPHAPGTWSSLYFLGVAVAAGFIANHVNNLDKTVRRGFSDALDLFEPRLTAERSADLLEQLRDLRYDLEHEGQLVDIARRIGRLNSEMVSRKLIKSEAIVRSDV